MCKYYIVYNDISSIDLVNIEKRPTKPSSNKEYEEVIVPGGKTLYIDKGYRDIEISVKCNFVSQKESWEKDYRKIKRWLHSKGCKKLMFSDDLEVFYKVNTVNIDTPERVLRQLGKFTVTFKCEPYCYDSNNEEILLGSQLYNDGEVTRPIYRVVGQGYLNMTINNTLIKANVGGELIIDTDKGLCFREGIINNVSLEGNYEDMYLLEGDNTFSHNTGFQVFISANRRYL